jgi:sec-independent protein translocase protein TatA
LVVAVFAVAATKPQIGRDPATGRGQCTHLTQGELMLTGILEPTHLIVILAVALVFLGPKRLPTAGRALGQGLKEFKDSISGEHPVNPQLHRAQVTAQQESEPIQ